MILRRPLLLVEANPAGVISWWQVGLYVGALVLFSLLVIALARWLRFGRLAAAASAALVLGTFTHWRVLDGIFSPWLLILLVIAIALIARGLEATMLPGISVIVAVVVGLAPAVQAIPSIVSRGTVQVVLDRPALTSKGQPVVEDVVVVILDSFSGIATLRDLYGYDSDLPRRLEHSGFVVPAVALSSAPTTYVALPDMLQGEPVVPDGVRVSPADREALYGALGGNNRFVRSLKSMGFRYNHMEGGWEGSKCGPEVDVCWRAPLFESTTWELWRSTPIGRWLEKEALHPFTYAALKNADRLPNVIGSVVGNGQRDLLFTHVLMPHFPFVVDSNCVPHRDLAHNVFVRYGPEGDRVERFLDQVRCAERIAISAVEAAGDEAIVVMSGDHGIAAGEEVEVPALDSEAAALFEQLNVFLAYRLPEQCERPRYDWTVGVLEAVLGCVSGSPQPPAVPEFSVFADSRGRDWSKLERLGDAETRRLAAMVENADAG